MCLIAKVIRYHTLNFIAIDLQLYKIFKITRVLFFGTRCSLVHLLCRYDEILVNGLPGMQRTLRDHGYELVHHAVCVCLLTPRLDTHSSLPQRAGSGE